MKIVNPFEPPKLSTPNSSERKSLWLAILAWMFLATSFSMIIVEGVGSLILSRFGRIELTERYFILSVCLIVGYTCASVLSVTIAWRLREQILLRVCATVWSFIIAWDLFGRFLA